MLRTRGGICGNVPRPCVHLCVMCCMLRVLMLVYSHWYTGYKRVCVSRVFKKCRFVFRHEEGTNHFTCWLNVICEHGVAQN